MSAPAPVPAPHGYVWSRWTAKPVEHIAKPADRHGYGQPLCGARLNPERMVHRYSLSGIAALCTRCQARAARLTIPTGDPDA